jgi:crotonobetaine/carnitine-CoA ligase
VKLSFAELHARADRTALALAALGVQRGERVFGMLRNRAEHLDLLIGCARIGAVYVPINTELKGWSLQHQVHNGDPRVMVVEATLMAAFEAVEPQAVRPVALVVLGDEAQPVPPAWTGIRRLDGAGFLACADGSTYLPCDPAPSEIGCIMYTSGTTGPAKGVLMPHAHLALFSLPAPGLHLGEQDVYYVCMPLFHANALFIQVFAALLAGAQVHCVERFSPGRWLSEVRSCGATVTNLLGAMTEMLHKTPAQAEDADNPVRTILAVPVADEWIATFCRRFGVDVVQGFGMTECNMLAYSIEGDPRISGCAGTLRDELFEVTIVDPETDQPLAADEVGEIVVRPRVPGAFMQGYHGMPDKTVEAWRNLWFHTGDAGRIDASRRLHFVDRIKDRIRRRGENISAFEVEQALLALDGVAECAVIGLRVGDAGAEQEVMACLVRAAGSTLSEAQVLQHCLARVPRFAVPRFIEFVETLPRTASGKVRKQELRERGLGTRTWDREHAAIGAAA